MKRIIGVSIAAAALMAVAVAPKTESETIYHHEPLTVTIETYTDTATGTYIEPVTEPEIEFNGELTAVNVFPEPTPEPTPEPIYEPVYANNDGWTYYGVCTITHYCTGHCCNGPYTGTASGAPLTPYRTCASGSLPFGTQVLVNGEVWVVEDRGVNGMWLDLCVASHEEAVQRGMFQSEVWIR